MCVRRECNRVVRGKMMLSSVIVFEIETEIGRQTIDAYNLILHKLRISRTF